MAMQDVKSISGRQRAAAILIANIFAALVVQLFLSASVVRTSRAPREYLLHQTLGLFLEAVVVFTLVSALPAYLILSRLLRGRFPSLVVVAVLGALLGFVVSAVITFLVTLGFGFTIATAAPFIMIFFPTALLAGAAGAAAGWCYLAFIAWRATARP